MERTSKRGGVGVAVALGWALVVACPLHGQQTDGYARSSAGTRQLSFPNGTTIKLLLEAANLGSDEIEVGEITFAPGSNPTSGHRHGAMEMFYVVEGVLGHVVNGEEHRLEPGMVGVVKPGDSVAHRVLSEGPVKAVVIWVPGGEADRIAPPERWTRIGGDT
ncbi:MAG: cupin domain-containing protein [Gemmatimonadota bacterium]